MLIITHIKEARGVVHIRMTDRNHDDNYDGMQEHHPSSSHRYRILCLIETFVDQIFHIRKTLLGVSISAIIMAPIAIGLSVYLLPSQYK